MVHLRLTPSQIVPQPGGIAHIQNGLTLSSLLKYMYMSSPLMTANTKKSGIFKKRNSKLLKQNKQFGSFTKCLRSSERSNTQ